MFIVLEGVDGAGKTSLANEVAELIGPSTEIVHSGPLKAEAVKSYALAFEDYVPESGRSIICDRLHIGELIYGPLYRDESKLSEAAFRWVELYLASIGAVVFHVSAPLEVIESRLSDRGEDFLQSHHVEHVWKQFGLMTQKSTICMGTVQPGLEDNLPRRLVDAAAYRESASNFIFDRWPSYIGKPMPRTLLVGDKRGGKPPYDTRAPFIVKSTSSGTFLMSSLDETWWKEVGIVNAGEVEDLNDLWDALNFPTVVALGKKAHETLDKADIPHGAVPHPQYIRRFHNSMQHEYGVLITNVAESEEKRLSWPKR